MDKVPYVEGKSKTGEIHHIASDKSIKMVLLKPTKKYLIKLE